MDEEKKEAAEGRPATKKPDWDQQDVLDEKDHVTRTGRGLQVWGDEEAVWPDAPGAPAQAGEASEGTAERSARIGRAQRRQAEEGEAPAPAREGEGVGRLHRPALDDLPPLSSQRPEGKARAGEDEEPERGA